MAIKQVAILMTIDDSPTRGDSCRTRRSDNNPVRPTRISVPGADQTYEVIVINDEDRTPTLTKEQQMLDCAAHELGHVLSSIFEVPGGMAEDPRTLGEFVGNRYAYEHPTESQQRRIYQNEKLAWEIGKKIRPEIDEDDMRTSLASYE